MRISNWKYWNGLIETIREMSNDDRKIVIEYFNQEAAKKRKLDTAESCMRRAIERAHAVISPMKQGVEEYDDIMQAQDLLED